MHAEFLTHNHTVTELCAAWQLAETGIGDAVTAARTDPAWITATERDSGHRVWFEFHEDLIATLGLTRD